MTVTGSAIVGDDVGKFRIGAAYYELSHVRGEKTFYIAVRTWIYDGYVVTECGSSQCDVPNTYLQFSLSERIKGRWKTSRRTRMRFPKYVQADRSMLSFGEFQERIQ